MPVLISIKTRFANYIFRGVKRIEFRKSFSRSLIGERAIVYSSGIDKAIVGEFRIKSIHYDTINNLWNRFGVFGSISRDELFKYFGNKKFGFAIEIANPIRYPRSISLYEIRRLIRNPNWLPPVNYVILSDNDPILSALNRALERNSQ